jgi:hypothetical protein
MKREKDQEMMVKPIWFALVKRDVLVVDLERRLIEKINKKKEKIY